jgi:hypothetical protein
MRLSTVGLHPAMKKTALRFFWPYLDTCRSGKTHRLEIAERNFQFFDDFVNERTAESGEIVDFLERLAGVD